MLKDSSSSFPPEFAAFRILPSLVSALEFGGASAASIVPLILQFGNSVPPEDHYRTVLMPLVKLYANPDRGTRMALLDSLPEYAEKLDKKVVIDQVWPNIVSVRFVLSMYYSLASHLANWVFGHCGCHS